LREAEGAAGHVLHEAFDARYLATRKTERPRGWDRPADWALAKRFYHIRRISRLFARIGLMLRRVFGRTPAWDYRSPASVDCREGGDWI
jgi:hypothetical protein